MLLVLCSLLLSTDGHRLLHDKSARLIQDALTIESRRRSLSFVVLPPSFSSLTLYSLTFSKTISSFSKALSEMLSVEEKHSRF